MGHCWGYCTLIFPLLLDSSPIIIIIHSAVTHTMRNSRTECTTAITVGGLWWVIVERGWIAIWSSLYALDRARGMGIVKHNSNQANGLFLQESSFPECSVYILSPLLLVPHSDAQPLSTCCYASIKLQSLYFNGHHIDRWPATTATDDNNTADGISTGPSLSHSLHPSVCPPA